MKQGFAIRENVADTVHIAKQMQGAALASTSSSTSSHGMASTPLGAHIQEQFQHHLQSSEFTAVERHFVEPLLGMVGQECVQVLLLRARVAFTKLVETCMDEGGLFGLEGIIKTARSAVI